MASQGWWQRLSQLWADLGRDHISLFAAAIAYYALLSIFPGMFAAISTYGLVADPALIEQHVMFLAGVVPAEALKLLTDQLHTLVAAPPAKLGASLIISLLLGIWTATSATAALMQALTVAYEEEEDRGVLHFYGLAVGLTVGLILLGLASMFLIAGVPAIVSLLPLTEAQSAAVSLVRWPLLAALALVALGFVYRVAPRRHSPRWEILETGTIAAALLWLAGSAGFSVYVGEFGSYDKTYGSIGAVVVLLVWFYATAYIVLAGAELNAQSRSRVDAGTDRDISPLSAQGTVPPRRKARAQHNDDGGSTSRSIGSLGADGVSPDGKVSARGRDEDRGAR
jgi:membrane protein